MTDELSLAFTREPWVRYAACRGMDTSLWFPERGEDSKQAKAVCATCPVIDDCSDYANRLHVRFGIWGGKGGHAKRRSRHLTDPTQISAYPADDLDMEAAA